MEVRIVHFTNIIEAKKCPVLDKGIEKERIQNINFLKRNLWEAFDPFHSIGAKSFQCVFKCSYL